MTSKFDPVDSRLSESWPFDYDALVEHLAQQQAEDEFGGRYRFS